MPAAGPIETPFGTIYSTNITPDAETGIGAWSYPAFERSMRRVFIATAGSFIRCSLHPFRKNHRRRHCRRSTPI